MVRYSSNLIFGVEKDEPIKYVPGISDAIDADQFTSVLNLFLDTLTVNSSSGDSLKKFAAGHVNIQGSTKNQSIYALVQCTPDMDKQSCSDCLKGAASKIPDCCGGKQGGRVLKPSCNLRFESTLFYESTADSLVTLPPVKGMVPLHICLNLINCLNYNLQLINFSCRKEKHHIKNCHHRHHCGCDCFCRYTSYWGIDFNKSEETKSKTKTWKWVDWDKDTFD